MRKQQKVAITIAVIATIIFTGMMTWRLTHEPPAPYGYLNVYSTGVRLIRWDITGNNITGTIEGAWLSKGKVKDIHGTFTGTRNGERIFLTGELQEVDIVVGGTLHGDILTLSFYGAIEEVYAACTEDEYEEALTAFKQSHKPKS